MVNPIRWLIDQFGTRLPPEQAEALDQEISPTGSLHGRPPFQGHMAFGVNPSRLAGIMRAAEAGNTLDWMILAEEIEELYPHYSAVLAKRRRQVAQLPVTVMAAGDDKPEYEEHAEFIRDWIKTDTLEQAMFDILDGIAKGYSVHEIVWETEPGRIRPKEFLYRPQRYFELNQMDGATLWLRTETGFQDLMPHKFLVHLHRSKSGLVVRSGLTWMVAFLWCYATFTLKDWALFVQAYGLPVRVGRYGPEASDGDKKTLWRAVRSIAGDTAAIIPKSMEMEFVTAADRAAGAQLYEKRLDWLDRTVSKLVLGGTAGTDAIHGGHAVGREHRAAEDDVEKFDASRLNVTLNRQIVPQMIAFTFGPQDKYPTVSVGRPDEIPLKDLVEAIADLGSQGLKVKSSEILARLQLTKPEEGDDVIGGTPEPIAKPIIPAPARVLPADGFTARRLLGGLVARHAEEDTDQILEALTGRLSDEAAGAMAGLTGDIQAAFHAAEDMRDLAARLHRLNLSSRDFGEAMARGMALAQLVGQASLIEELRGHL